jgi:hypothetical protein
MKQLVVQKAIGLKIGARPFQSQEVNKNSECLIKLDIQKTLYPSKLSTFAVCNTLLWLKFLSTWQQVQYKKKI